MKQIKKYVSGVYSKASEKGRENTPPPYYSHFAGCSRVFTYVHILSEGCFPNFSSCCKCRVHTVKLDKNQGLFQNFPGQNYYFSRTVLLLILIVILKQYRLIGKAANTILCIISNTK